MINASKDIPIVFCCPDAPEPSGGVRLILRHQRVLSTNGFSTYAFSPSTKGLSLWIKDLTNLHTVEPPGDFIRVVSESDRENLRRPGRKVVLAQSLQFGPSKLGPGEWKECGVEAVVAVSQYVRSGIESRFGIPATVIFPSVDRAMFRPKPKERLIAYMPRRNYLGILQIFDRYRPAGYTLVSIHGQSLTHVGEILSRAAIFLAASPREGFGLPALEAMASGCLVVGFVAEGGKDFMEDGANCLLAPDGDYERAAEALKLATLLFDEGRTEDLSQTAIKTAQRFSPGRETVELLRFWRRFLSESSGGPSDFIEQEPVNEE